MTIHVSKKTSDFVTISITDNGIGRKASAKIKEKKLLKRKSVGIDLTKKRLEHFSKNYTNSYKLHIEDLYNNNNNESIGTKVIIEIPIKEIQSLKQLNNYFIVAATFSNSVYQSSPNFLINASFTNL